MKKRLEAYINLRSGRMVMKDRDKYFKAISYLPDGLYMLTLSMICFTRSTSQNRYYWGVVVKSFQTGVEESWGDTVDSETAHEMLKYHCNYREHIMEDESVIRVPLSTKELSTTEFSEYTERCRKLIYEYFNIETPDPA